MQKFSLPSPLFPNNSDKRTDHFTLGSLAEFGTIAQRVTHYASGHDRDWTGRMSCTEAKDCAVSGHIPSVAPSDKFLSDVENLLPAPTARQEWRNDVAGAMPNVPALLAGQPLTMRRRVREVNEAAPIAIVCDMVLSGGISMEQMQQRGAAILALARALSSKRPVELWCGGSLQAHSVHACHYYFRVDTAPLDLARAAFIMAHPAAIRGLLYKLAEMDYNFMGGWPYAEHEKMRKHGEKVIRGMLPHVTDLIYIPGAFLSDDTIARPLEWIKRNVLAALPSQDEAA